MSIKTSAPSRLSPLFRKMVGRALGAETLLDRNKRLCEMEHLDPVEDCVEIYRLFRADFQAASSFAIAGGLFVTYAVPRMSRILTQSRQFEEKMLKRLVDTTLLDKTYHDVGFAPGPGRDAMRRINEMHRHYDIHPEDYVFIGCYEIITFVWFANRYGWRKVTEKEKEAAVEFAKHRAQYMYAGSQKMPYPKTLEEMQAFCDDYLDRQIAYEPQNKRLADRLVDFILGNYPEVVRRPLQAFFLSIGMDERLVTNCGYKMPSPRAQKLSCRLMGYYGKLDPLVYGLSPFAQKLVDELYPCLLYTSPSPRDRS